MDFKYEKSNSVTTFSHLYLLKIICIYKVFFILLYESRSVSRLYSLYKTRSFLVSFRYIYMQSHIIVSIGIIFFLLQFLLREWRMLFVNRYYHVSLRIRLIFSLSGIASSRVQTPLNLYNYKTVTNPPPKFNLTELTCMFRLGVAV